MNETKNYELSGKTTPQEPKSFVPEEKLSWWHYVNTFLLIPLCAAASVYFAYYFFTNEEIFKNVSTSFYFGREFSYTLAEGMPFFHCMSHAVSVLLAIYTFYRLCRKTEYAPHGVIFFHVWNVLSRILLFVLAWRFLPRMIINKYEMIYFWGNVILLITNGIYYSTNEYLFC